VGAGEKKMIGLRSILIFGATKGIGNMLAEYYKDKGWEVTIAGRHAVSASRLNFVKADVSREESVTKAFNAHSKKWGKAPDVVINCAGIQGPIGNSWLIPIDKFRETLDINLTGSFIVARIAAGKMLACGKGSIIMFSGGGAVYGRPNFNAYAISKTGVLRMVETIAEELRIAGYPNIIINAVAPGAVKTGMTDEILKVGKDAGGKALREAVKVIKNGGTPAREIFDLVDFLVDLKRNKGITGRLIHVKEDYDKLIRKYGRKVPEDTGKIRRIPIK